MSLPPYTTERNASFQHVMLDANEHFEQWVVIPTDILSILNRYPDKYARDLRNSLSDYYCSPFSPDNIFVSSGSIEAIDIIINSLNPKRLILNTPTYDVYAHRALAHDIPLIKIPLEDDGQPSINRLLTCDAGDLVVMINPNNPTGHLLKPDAIKEFIGRFKGMLIIDEAYIEYAGLNHSLQHLALEHKNIIILRTFSKAWGLAGVRLGYALASPKLIKQFELHQNPYSVNAIAMHCGINALLQVDKLEIQVQKVKANKKVLIDKLRLQGIKVSDTEANFILVELPDIDEGHRILRAKGILVRRRPLLGGESDCLRVTVGSQTDTEIFSRAISELVL